MVKIMKLFTLIFIAATSAFILTSCGLQNQNDNVIIEKKHKKITVLTKNEEVVTNELALEKIDRYEGTRGVDWLSEESILIERKNTDLPKTAMTDNGQYVHHINLFSYDLMQNKLKVISGEENGQVGAIISPDKKHIFYKQSIDGNTGTGYIIDVNNKKKVKVSEVDKIFAFEGRWLNNNEVIFPTLDQQMYTADVQGNIVKINPNTDKVTSLKKKLGGIKVEWVIPSPDKKKFAIVRKITQTKRELFITDTNGKKTVTLAKGTQIFGSSWSPDSKSLAFSVISEDKGERGLFVIDVNTRKITQLSTDLDEISGPITWSPSGKKLLVSKVIMKNNKNEFVAYILTLKN